MIVSGSSSRVSPESGFTVQNSEPNCLCKIIDLIIRLFAKLFCCSTPESTISISQEESAPTLRSRVSPQNTTTPAPVARVLPKTSNVPTTPTPSNEPATAVASSAPFVAQSVAQPPIPAATPALVKPVKEIKMADLEVWLQFFENAEKLIGLLNGQLAIFQKFQGFKLEEFSPLLVSTRAGFKDPFDGEADLLPLQQLLEQVGKQKFVLEHLVAEGSSRINQNYRTAVVKSSQTSFIDTYCDSINSLHLSLAEVFFRREDFDNAFVAIRRLDDGIEKNGFFVKLIKAHIVKLEWKEASTVADRVSGKTLQDGCYVDVVEECLMKQSADSLEVALSIAKYKMSGEVQAQYYVKIFEAHLNLGDENSLKAALLIVRNNMSGKAQEQRKDPYYAKIFEVYLKQGDEKSLEAALYIVRNDMSGKAEEKYKDPYFAKVVEVYLSQKENEKSLETALNIVRYSMSGEQNEQHKGPYYTELFEAYIKQAGDKKALETALNIVRYDMFGEQKEEYKDPYYARLFEAYLNQQGDEKALKTAVHIVGYNMSGEVKERYKDQYYIKLAGAYIERRDKPMALNVVSKMGEGDLKKDLLERANALPGA